MEPRTVIITGGNTGLGYETAKNIAATDPNYHVVLACRSAARGEAAARELEAVTGNTHITTMTLDLGSLASVRAFYDAYCHTNLPPLYAVICNAGISAGGVPGSPRTDDGVEMIFGVNHLGHFLLTNLLLNVMAGEGRIVFVTSDLHNPPRFFPITVRYDNATAIAEGTSGMQQYCISKLCNLYSVYELARLIAQRTDKRITVNAFNPGAMTDTGFSRPSGGPLVRAGVAVIGGIMGALIGKHSTAPESGAALSSLVTDPSLAGATGKYIDRGTEAQSSALSYDLDNATELWDTSMKISQLGWSETVFGPRPVRGAAH
jgi:NAD(P)-dependent dehydrogenase (short-subunit alcohol dehydrogenase family)